MRLTHLSLTNFRNFTRLDLDVPSGTILLAGKNAQGKTSLLEAVYLLATLASFHAETDRQLIHFTAAPELQSAAHIAGEFEKNGKTHKLHVRVIQERGMDGAARLQKDARLDGLPLKLSEAVGLFNAVLFIPQMMQVIEGGPAHRRRYLDLALAQVIPDYTAVLSAYNKVVTQRNALLKQLGEQGGDPAQLEYWDTELAGYGARLIHARIQAVREIGALAAQTHLELTRRAEVLRMDYQPAYDPLPGAGAQLALRIDDPKDRSGFSLEQIRQGFSEALKVVRAEEIRRGVTVLGPHRDELRFLSNATDLGSFGSRGQVRTTMLTLKLAELAWMGKKTGALPVLLLDEVLAELDEYRRADLLGRLADCPQALLTTADLASFEEEFVRKAAVWRVEAGRIATGAR